MMSERGDSRDAARDEAWEALRRHGTGLETVQMRALFAQEPDRAARLSVSLGDLHCDYSKNVVTAETLSLLDDLARASGLQERRAAMFAGEAINRTEGRAVLHTALRAGADAAVAVDGMDVMPGIRTVAARAAAFADSVRNGDVTGATGRPFDAIVNIGIGGSDLGPYMAALALSPYGRTGLSVFYVSNLDGAHIADTLRGLDPARTLFIVASKTFTTQETMANARHARTWLAAALGEDAVDAHFAAVSTNAEAVRAFGMSEKRMFPFGEWVGGRYSVWSSIGLSLMIFIGPERFAQFLDGARTMDEHFRTAPNLANMPVLLALLGIWNRNVRGCPAHAVIPYDQRLARFPAFLQQLDMESNGKSVTLSGDPVSGETGPIVFGEPGTNAQHAFFQLLHQGTDVVPVDFLVAAEPHETVCDQHAMLVANCLAQSEALMKGRTLEEARDQLVAKGMDAADVARIAPHRVFPGNRPSTTLLYRKLDPATLGSLIALYEHKIFVQSVVWDINAFDQWGVELGKELASSFLPSVRDGEQVPFASASTQTLIARYRSLRSG